MAGLFSGSVNTLWAAVGAGAATVVAVVGIAAGPSAVSCFGSEDGFGACMRDRLAQTGLLGPQAEEAVTPPTELVAEAEPLEPVSDEEAEITATPTPETTTEETPVEAEAVEQAAVESTEVVATPEVAVTPTIPPRLGLVRAEPDGSLVIAGSAAPGAELEIYANGELLGTVTAESSGDWVFLPNEPLPPGGVEISVADTETGQLAEQSVVVVVQDDLTTEPLVVASTPGEASQVLQGLSTDAVSEPEPIVVAEESATDDSAAIAAINETPLDRLPETAPLVAEEETITAETETETETIEVAVADPEDVPEVVEEETVVIASVAPTIDAIEVDGDRNFFAGSGTDGTTIRLYVDDGFVADTIVSDGRWLVETNENFLTKPSQRVRIDMLRGESAEVAARAEVNFEINIPEIETPEPIVVVEQTPTEETAAPETTAVAEVETPAVQLDNPALALPDAPPTIDVAEADTAIESDDVVESAEAAPAETTPEVATQVDVSEQTADEELPTLTAVQVGDAEEGRFASGKAIIRSGDNLWTIASRVYGEGVRFTTIYQANRGQIRDPNLIYPGQVFELPEAE